MKKGTKYDKSQIMKRAWEIAKEQKITLSLAMKKSWAIAKNPEQTFVYESVYQTNYTYVPELVREMYTRSHKALVYAFNCFKSGKITHEKLTEWVNFAQEQFNNYATSVTDDGKILFAMMMLQDEIIGLNAK